MINMKKKEGDQSDALRDKERNMKIEMQVKIMEEVEQNMIQMKKEMNRDGEKQKKKEQEINSIVQKQDNDLN